MEEKQRITISGNNWNDIIKLPCFRELHHYYKRWKLVFNMRYIQGRKPRTYFEALYAVAYIGDTLIEYANGEWGLERASERERKDIGDGWQGKGCEGEAEHHR